MPDDGAGPDLFPPSPELAPPPPPPPPPPVRPRPSRRQMIGRRGATAAVATGLVAGGIAGGYVISQAASPAPAATASPSVGSGSATEPDHHDGVPGAGSAARTQDLQQLAGAIGISTAQLQSEMSAGKTIAAIAREHSVDPSKVITTLVADENAEIDTAVRSGQLTQAQAAQMKSEMTQRVTDLVNGTERAHGWGGPGGPAGMRGEDEQVVATAIGISTTQLQTELTAGKTIAAIATEHKVTTATVINAWVTSENAEIDQRVTSGQVTAAQGAQMKTMTVQRVTAEVNGTEPAGGFGRHDGAAPFAPEGSQPAN